MCFAAGPCTFCAGSPNQNTSRIRNEDFRTPLNLQASERVAQDCDAFLKWRVRPESKQPVHLDLSCAPHALHGLYIYIYIYIIVSLSAGLRRLVEVARAESEQPVTCVMCVTWILVWDLHGTHYSGCTRAWDRQPS